MAKKKRNFCTECREKTEYYLTKKNIVKNIKGKDYTFTITVAICTKCGKEMSIPGLIDKNVKEIDEQYRAAEGLVSINDIKKLMETYHLKNHIGALCLSLELGFEDETISKYLKGQVPSKENSDIIKTALKSPEYMEQKYIENFDKLVHEACVYCTKYYIGAI